MKTKAEKKKAKFEKQFHSPAYVTLVRSLPCIVPGCARRSEACHAVSKGAGGTWKDLFPACSYHHTGSDVAQHTMGMDTWMAYHKVDPFAVAERLASAWVDRLSRVS